VSCTLLNDQAADLHLVSGWTESLGTEPDLIVSQYTASPFPQWTHGFL